MDNLVPVIIIDYIFEDYRRTMLFGNLFLPGFTGGKAGNCQNDPIALNTHALKLGILKQKAPLKNGAFLYHEFQLINL
jgi:hypothetical protein